MSPRGDDGATTIARTTALAARLATACGSKPAPARRIDATCCGYAAPQRSDRAAHPRLWGRGLARSWGEPMPVPDNVEATVRALIDAAGLPVSDEEFESLVAGYPALRELADRLYIEEVRYEEPALIFTPLPPVRE